MDVYGYVYDIFSARDEATFERTWMNVGMRMILLNDHYKFNPTDHRYENVQEFETSGQGYKSGGKLLRGKTTWTDDNLHFGSESVEWAKSSVTARHCVLYDKSSLIACYTLGGLLQTYSGAFNLHCPPDGWVITELSLDEMIANLQLMETSLR